MYFNKINPFSNDFHAYRRLKDAKKNSFWFCAGTLLLSAPTAFIGTAGIFRWMVDKKLGPEITDKKVSGIVRGQTPLNAVAAPAEVLAIQPVITPLSDEEKQKLGWRTDFSNVTLNDFSHIHSSARIHATKFDGGDHRDKYKYWETLIQSLGNDSKYKEADLDAISKVISDGRNVDDLISLGKEGEVSNFIIDTLKKDGVFYLPTGWNHQEKNIIGGHFAILKFKLEGDQVKCYVINKGAGSQYHPIIEVDGTKVKRDLRSLATTISKEKFENGTGAEMIKRIVKLGTRPTKEKNSNVNPLSESDLYGLLFLFADAIIRNDGDSFFAAQGQRAGSCAEASLHAAFVDAGKEMSPTLTKEDEVKTFMFKFKQESLVHGFVEHYEEATRDPDVHLMLKDAAEQHAIRVLKREVLLSEAEIQQASDTAKFILSKLNEMSSKPVVESLPVEQAPQEAPSSPLVNTVDSTGTANETQGYEAAKATKVPHIKPEVIRAPARLVKYLKSNLQIARARMAANCDPVETFEEIYQLFSTLPHAREEAIGSMIWDSRSINAKKCFSAICQLNEVMAQCGARVEVMREVVTKVRFDTKTVTKALPFIDKGKMLEINYRSYDIAAQLAPKISALGISSKMGFTLDQDLIANRKIFSDPKSIAAINQVQENFKARNKGKEDRMLFPKSIGQSDYHHEYVKKLYGTISYGIMQMKLGMTPLREEPEVAALNTILKSKLPWEYYQLETLALMSEAIKQNKIEAFNLILQENNSKSKIRRNYFAFSDNFFMVKEFPFESNWSRETDTNKRDLRYENNIYVNRKYSKTQQKIPADIKQELLALETNASPELVLSWALDNMAHLENPDVRKEIEKILFKFDVLPKSIKESGDELQALANSFLTRAHELYSHNLSDISTLLWILKTTDTLNSHFKANGAPPLNALQTQEVYNQLHARDLMSEAKASLVEHQLDHFNHIPPNTPEDYTILLHCTFLHAQLRNGAGIFSSTLKYKPQEGGAETSTGILSTIMTFKAQEAITKYYNEAVAQMSSSLEPVAKSLLGHYIEGTDNLGGFTLQGNELTNGTYSIFIDQGLAFKDKKYLDTYSELFKGQGLYEKFFGDTGLNGYIENGYLYETNGMTRLCFEEDKINFVEKQINGTWYRYEASLSQELFIPNCLKGSDYAYWISCDANKPEVIISKIEGSILNSKSTYVYSAEKGLRVSQDDGTATENRILYLANAQGTIEGAWRNYVSPIELVQNTLVEVNIKGGNEVVNKVTFPRMGLTFERNPEGQLESTLYKGYYLSPKYASPFTSFKGAIVLENQQGKTKVIIPGHPLTELESPNNSIAITTKVNTNKANFIDSNAPYFIYEGKKDEPIAKAATPEAALYLAIIYRNEKQYEKALACLKKSTHSNKNTQLEWEIAKQVLSQKDYSSEGIAFDLHLCKRMHEQEGKINRQTREDSPELSELQKAFSEHSQQQYMRYLNYKSNEKADVYQIPDRFRITPAMEIALPVKKWGHRDTDTVPTPLSDFSILTAEIEKGKIPLLSQFHHYFLENLHNTMSSEKVAQNMIRNLQLTKNFEGDPRFVYASAKLRFEKNENLSVYIYNNFNVFLKQACSDNENERKLAMIDLLFLSRHYKETDHKLYLKESEKVKFLIEILLYASVHHQEFKDCIPDEVQNSDSGLENCLVKIMKKKDLKVPQEGEEKPKIEDLESCSEIVQLFAPPPNLEFTITHHPSKHDQDPTLPEVMSSELSLPPLEFQNVSKPLETIYNEFFTPGEVQIKITKANLFSEKDIKNAHSELARAQMLSYNMARKTKTQDHHFNDGKIDDLKAKLDSQQNHSLNKVQESKDGILQLANKNPVDENIGWSAEKRQQLLQMTGQKRTLNYNDILAGFLAQDASAIKKANPFLTDEDVQTIFGKLVDLCLQESQRLQVGEALDIINQIEKGAIPELYQQLGVVLARKRHYEPSDYPLLAIYEGTTGRMLREDQFEAIKWAMEGIESNQIKDPLRLLQAFAGFGKTKVFTTIFAMMLAQKGYLPVIVNISNLYDFGKSDLGNSLMQAFKQHMEVFEVNLGDKLTLDQLKKFHQNLDNWQNERKCLVMIPESWHYLNIQYKDALINDDAERLKVLSGILNFFKEKGFIISDEAHLICNPLQEAIKAIGLPQKLSVIEMDLFIKNYQILLKNEVIRLREGGQSFVTEKELPDIKKELIDASLDYSIFQHVDKDELREFLASPFTARPEWLQKMKADPKEHELALLISLQHGFVQAVLEHVLSQKDGIDYGESIHPGDQTTGPRHDKEPTNAKFSDEYIWAALTIQRTHQNGFNLEGTQTLLAQLKEKHLQERRYESDKPDTAANSLLKTWLTGSDLEINLEHLSLKDEKTVRLIHNKIYKNEEAINHFLMTIALLQIDIFKSKINSTPAELLTAFAGGLLLTATPGAIETLPVSISRNPDKNNLDRASEAETIEAMLSERNNNVITVNSFNINEFFQDILQNHPEALDELAYIVDRGAGFRNEDSGTIVQAYLDFVKEQVESKDQPVNYTGGVYVDNAPDGKGRTAVFQGTKKDDKPALLEGSDLVEAIKQRGLDPELLAHAFYYYSIRETTGTDWKLPKPSKGLFTVGEQQTATQSIQAVKRDRQICSETQSITWVLPKKLLAAMGKSENDSVKPKEILIWMINNEAREQEKKIWMRFQQGLDNIIIQHAKHKLNATSDPKDKQCLASIVKKENLSTTYDRFYEPPAIDQLDDKQKALMKIVMNAVKPLGITDLRGFTKQEQDELNILIDQTTKLMSKISAITQDFRAESLQETVKEQQELEDQLQEQLSEQVNQNAEGVNASIIESYNQDVYSITFADFPNLQLNSVEPLIASDPLRFQFNDNDERITPHAYFEDKFGPEVKDLPKLILSYPFMLKSGDKKLDASEANNVKEFMRPPKAILVQIDTSVNPPAYQYIALSTGGYAHYKQEIVEGKNTAGKEYVILSLNGSPLAKTKNMSSPVAALQTSDETRKILALAALMNGRIRNVKVVADMVAPLGQQGFKILIDDLQTKALALSFKLDTIGIAKVMAENATIWETAQTEALLK